MYGRECSGYPGFITKFRVTDKTSQGSNETDTVDFENYRHVCHKWHYKIAKALVVCLESKDFVQIRNSLIVLTKIIQHFPVIQNLATVIEKRVEKVNRDIRMFSQFHFIFSRFVMKRRRRDRICTSRPEATKDSCSQGSQR